MAVRGKNFFTEKRRGKEGMELRATTVWRGLEGGEEWGRTFLRGNIVEKRKKMKKEICSCFLNYLINNKLSGNYYLFDLSAFSSLVWLWNSILKSFAHHLNRPRMSLLIYVLSCLMDLILIVSMVCQINTYLNFKKLSKRFNLLCEIQALSEL